MKLDLQSIGKSFAPSLMGRAVRAFDSATMVVVSVCWGGAILVLLFTIYTINLTMTAKRESLEAAAKEPNLPKIVNKKPVKDELKPFLTRLQRLFPEISFVLGRDQTLIVMTSDAGNFRLWLTVLSYIDTMSPQYRWGMKEFCVGMACDKGIPMKAVLTAEKISFSATEEKK